MKKILFIAVAMIATSVLFCSCEKSVRAQAFVNWGFESTENPGTIDGNPFMGITLKYVQEAVEEEVENNENWMTQVRLGSGGVLMHLSATTEENTKKELTDLFEIAIKKAEDTMKGKGYEAQSKTETVLAQYEFIKGESEMTTLRFTVPVYVTPADE